MSVMMIAFVYTVANSTGPTLFHWVRMTNELYARMQATAKHLIQKYGQAGTIKRLTLPDRVLGGEPQVGGIQPEAWTTTSSTQTERL
ncbi:hypothetical protein [Rhizobium grahamii]|uniref:hypothetical protein n=1 Tax=Rhizobium grahamii TaxID=1120045 RepID=UPI00314567F8